MIDRKILRDDDAYDAYERSLRRRGDTLGIRSLATIRQDEHALRQQKSTIQEFRTALNVKTKSIGEAMRNGDTALAHRLKADATELSKTISALKNKIADNYVDAQLSCLPNWLDDEVPEGSDEASNLVIKDSVGDLPQGKPHWDLGPDIGIDPEAGARLSGSRFTVLRGKAALLNRELSNFLLDNALAHSFELVSTPVLVNPEIMEGTGQLPKFEEDAYKVLDGEDENGDDRFKYLIPTAEVSLTNLYRDTITDIEQGQAVRMCALTPCFRREAGSAGRDTRGLLRQHQFEKVELVSICQAEQAEFEHEAMMRVAERALEKLDLKYRRVLLCAGDTGFSARKTYDLEVWMAGQREFREIASISQCGDFQSRRMNARIRVDGGKTEFPHTLNGSALAVGRLLAACVETHGIDEGMDALMCLNGIDTSDIPEADEEFFKRAALRLLGDSWDSENG